MGSRKRIKAEERKEAMKSIAIAKLNNCPTSPRKMRLVADTVRGKDVFEALNILRFSAQDASIRLEKLLRSAIANWEAKMLARVLKTLNLKFARSQLILQECLSVFSQLLKVERTAFASVLTT